MLIIKPGAKVLLFAELAKLFARFLCLTPYLFSVLCAQGCVRMPLDHFACKFFPFLARLSKKRRIFALELQ